MGRCIDRVGVLGQRWRVEEGRQGQGLEVGGREPSEDYCV